MSIKEHAKKNWLLYAAATALGIAIMSLDEGFIVYQLLKKRNK